MLSDALLFSQFSLMILTYCDHKLSTFFILILFFYLQVVATKRLELHPFVKTWILTDWRITWPNLHRSSWFRPSHPFEAVVNEVERRGLLNLFDSLHKIKFRQCKFQIVLFVFLF